MYKKRHLQNSMQLFAQAFFVCVLMTPLLVGATVSTFTTSSAWNVPANVTSITVRAWGPGGGGGSQGSVSGAAGGGGGGAYSSAVISVTPGAAYDVVIGAGAAGANGGTTCFGVSPACSVPLVSAEGGFRGLAAASGGTGGAGGSFLNGIGDITYSGGTGASASGGSSGGGGGGAGTTGSGGNAGTAPAAGTGTSLSGGAGGTGVTNANGGAGSSYGGGGAGSARTSGNRTGGVPGTGAVEIEYTAAVPVLYAPIYLMTGKLIIGAGKVIIY